MGVATLKLGNKKDAAELFKVAKETQTYRTVLWTLWERERVG